MWLSSNAHNHLRLPHRPEAPGAGQRAQVHAQPVQVRLARKYLVTSGELFNYFQNFIVAQEIKSKMDQLEEEQIVLENQLSVAKAARMAPPASAVSPSDNSAAGQLDPSDQSINTDNPKVTLKCLRLLVATLQDPSITQLNNTLITLLEEFVTVSVKSQIAAIRKEAILALSCCRPCPIESVRQHMLLLLLQVIYCLTFYIGF